MATTHVKKGEEVVIIAGAHRGKRGKLISFKSGAERAFVEGVNLIKRHTRKSAQHPEGAIVEREGAIHVSNLQSAVKVDARKGNRQTASLKG